MKNEDVLKPVADLMGDEFTEDVQADIMGWLRPDVTKMIKAYYDAVPISRDDWLRYLEAQQEVGWLSGRLFSGLSAAQYMACTYRHDELKNHFGDNWRDW